jgi:hypothetical protein
LVEPTDAVVRVLRACICGSDLWPYGSRPATREGDRIGHGGCKAVTNLHMDAARHPDHPRLTELVRELSTRNADFRKWWHGQHVESKGQGTKRFHHPVVGDLTLDWDTLICDTAPDQFVIVLTAQPGTPSHDALRILASWADDQASQVTLMTTLPEA